MITAAAAAAAGERLKEREEEEGLGYVSYRGDRKAEKMKDK
jgi:hypothetical protein